MKKYCYYLLILSVIATGVTSCQKTEKTLAPYGYDIKGFYDVAVTPGKDTSFTMPIKVEYLYGNAELVNVTVLNCPPGVTFTPAFAEGTGTFTTNFTFHVNLSRVGITYPIIIYCTSPSTSTHSVTFNISVL